jgi:group I intron endonuclease
LSAEEGVSICMTTQSGVYLLRNTINGKIYIGKAKNLKNRLWNHSSSENNNAKQLHSGIIAAIRKYGFSNFEIEILESGDIDNQTLLDKEAEYIEKYNSTNPLIGYNILKKSSDWTGFHHTEETKKKISRNRKGLTAGKNNPIWGKKRPQYVKDAISLANRGKEAYNRKSLVQIDPKTKQIVKEFKCVKDAANELGCSLTHIASVARGGKRTRNGKTVFEKTAGGFEWKYV